MPTLTPDVLARLEKLEALAVPDWQQASPDYKPLEIIGNFDGGYGDDSTDVRYHQICDVCEEQPPEQSSVHAELIPLMRNNLRELLQTAARLSATEEQLDATNRVLAGTEQRYYDADLELVRLRGRVNELLNSNNEQLERTRVAEQRVRTLETVQAALQTALRLTNDECAHWAAETAKSTTVYPASEYQDEYGDVLWWNFPVCEPPHFSSPSSSDWPDDRWTHFSRMPIVYDGQGMPRREVK